MVRVASWTYLATQESDLNPVSPKAPEAKNEVAANPIRRAAGTRRG